MNRDALIHKLKSSGIPLEQWGRGKAKTIDHLLEEINSEETKLLPGQGRSLLRTVQVASITVTYDDGTKVWILHEEKQVFKDGRERHRNMHSSLGEKMTFAEEPIDAARRALREELQITEEIPLQQGGLLVRGPEESSSYPGLATLYRFWDYLVQLPAHLFKPEGYTEVQEDKTTYFVWK